MHRHRLARQAGDAVAECKHCPARGEYFGVTLRKGQPALLGNAGRRNEGSEGKLENQRFVSSPKPKPNQYHWCAVYDGKECIGHIVGRGKLGVEAYDAHDRSVGIFSTVPIAASALIDGGES
jgi:hypothetical protein